MRYIRERMRKSLEKGKNGQPKMGNFSTTTSILLPSLYVQMNESTVTSLTYLYGASALATAASSGSHLSPLANSFSLL
jgi:hypothetical protein